MNQNRALTKDSLAIFFLSLLVFLISLTPEFISFQTRFALFAKEMLWHGISFFPITYQDPYPDYPGASTFMIYLTSFLSGRVTPLSAVFPTALVSSIILALTYRLGAMHSRKWGLCAVLLALFTQFYFTAARSISPDQYISLITLSCFYFAYKSKPHNNTLRIFVFLLLFFVGFLFRGPIGFVIPAGVTCFYYLCERGYKIFFTLGFLALILLIISMVLLLLAAHHQGGNIFVKEVIETQILSRMQHDAKSVPFYFYWFRSFGSYAISFPLAVIIIFTRIQKIINSQTPHYRLIKHLTIWSLVVIVGMSIPGDKKIRYILPIVPAISLISGYIFIDEAKTGFLVFFKKLFGAFCTLLPFLLLVLATTAALANYYKFHLQAHFIISIILLSLLMLVIPLVKGHFKSLSSSKEIIALAIAVLAYIIFSVGIIAPVNYSLEQTKPFVNKVIALQKQHPAPIIFYQIGPDAEDIKFLVNLDKPITPHFIQSQAALYNYYHKPTYHPAYFIALQEDFTKLPQSMRTHIVATGKIGHRKSVCFTLWRNEN